MQTARSPRHLAPAAAGPRHRATPAPSPSVHDARPEGLGRRGFLALAGAGSAVAVVGVPALAAPAGAASPRWAGHQPGRVYLGVSGPTEIDRTARSLGSPLGARRTFYTWNQVEHEVRQIRADHAAHRLPWVSFKPPGGASAWAGIAAGRYDADIRRRAAAYAGLSKPLVVTFHHEPSNDSPNGAAWAAAFSRIHDVLRDSADLPHMTFAPIIGDWAFNQMNKKVDPADWLTSGALKRTDMLGVDCYQNDTGRAFDTRLEYIHSWLTRAGHGETMIGIGECGATEKFGNVSAASWWNTSWRWAEANTDKIGVISYFNSMRNSQSHVYWPLDESSAKTAAFQRSLGSSVTTRLNGLTGLPATGAQYGGGGSGTGSGSQGGGHVDGQSGGGTGTGGGEHPWRRMTGYGRSWAPAAEGAAVAT